MESLARAVAIILLSLLLVGGTTGGIISYWLLNKWSLKVESYWWVILLGTIIGAILILRFGVWLTRR